MKRVLRPQPRQDALQLVVLTQGASTITTLMIAAFHENWDIRFVHSLCGAVTLLRRAPSVGLVYDWDSHKGDWRELCSACLQRGVPFHLMADTPPDDVFLAVAYAGGAGVLWKGFSAEQVIATIGSARSRARTDRDDDAAPSAIDPNARRCE